MCDRQWENDVLCIEKGILWIHAHFDFLKKCFKQEKTMYSTIKRENNNEENKNKSYNRRSAKVVNLDFIAQWFTTVVLLIFKRTIDICFCFKMETYFYIKYIASLRRYWAKNQNIEEEEKQRMYISIYVFLYI